VPVPSPTPAEARRAAIIEVLLCSDYPTQIALGNVRSAGFQPRMAMGLRPGYVAGISLLDSIFLTALVVFFPRGPR
jgi:hypothetical protein